ncbi:MAG: enoyl-CoA hydratase/isomerase family protein [Archangiaceae bacterium]|nr:enoyl-CoA hydratase/isomerase family protein [Archangiaceae bacterium]
MEFVKLEVADGIGTLTIDRPKALNALNSQVLAELLEAVGQVKALRALIVTGGGEKSFVAGADIGELLDGRLKAEAGHQVMDAIDALPIPVIAAVNGFALGGGCELALACDFIYASEKAKLGLPEVTLGVIPGWGGTQRLARLVGPARAKELIATGDMVDAAKAREIGLALDVLPADKLLAHCRDVAGKIAKRGPLAVTAALQAVDGGLQVSLKDGCALEREKFAALMKTADQAEGMKAFLEKRPPVFKGA